MKKNVRRAGRLIALRLSPTEESLVDQAVAADQVSVSEFIRGAALEKASNVTKKSLTDIGAELDTRAGTARQSVLASRNDRLAMVEAEKPKPTERGGPSPVLLRKDVVDFVKQVMRVLGGSSLDATLVGILNHYRTCPKGLEADLQIVHARFDSLKEFRFRQ